MNNDAMNVGVQIARGDSDFISLCIYPEVDLLDHMVVGMFAFELYMSLILDINPFSNI